MLLFSILFLLGDVMLQQLAILPNLYWMIVTVIFLIISIKYKKYYFIAFITGFLWAFLYALLHLSWDLPADLEGKTISVEGYIASLPETNKEQAAFLFSLKKINSNAKHGLIRLSWRYPSEKLTVGDKWQLSVRLKRIHGLMNPGGFDYEAWAFQENIHASGYVVVKNKNILLSHHLFFSPINRFRQILKERIEAHLPVTNTSPWIIALALGERHGISQDNWEVLRKTGTNHLMAIAGLHIGFMSAFIFTLISFLWRYSSRLTLMLPAQHAGAIAALVVALIYSSLAGFLIPTQRASIMLISFLGILLLRRQALAWQAWCLALLSMLLINPLSVLTESFWLSFGSVALIIYGVSARINPQGMWWKWGRIQWVIAFGLIPLSLWLFQQCSIVSFFANSIAIPWVGFVIVPLTLLGAIFILFSVKIGTLILIFADKNLAWLWSVLTYFSHLSWSVWYQYIPHHWMLAAACVSIVLFLLPSGFPGRWLGVIWILPVVLYKPMSLNTGEVKFTLLDVGQGLASVVQTKNHVLVFDAGARLSDSYDMGNSVVVPFLRTLAIEKLDILVISHGDNDHAGGANAILKQIQVRNIFTSVPEKFKSSQYCLRNQSWDWDGVKFEFLYPPPENLNLNNDSSCVLKIVAGDKSILLTGDIEKFAEKYLVENVSGKLKTVILVAPHHGSKTSAENAFLAAVQPEYVLFPVGYRNRYHFPNVSVIEKYRQLNTKQFDTVQAGAISFYIAPHVILTPQLYRISNAHYWNYNASL